MTVAMNIGKRLAMRELEPEILTAWAERCSGPGWANQLIWVIEKSRMDGKLSRRAIQPEELTKEIWQLFDIAEAAHIALMHAVINQTEQKRKRNRRKAKIE